MADAELAKSFLGIGEDYDRYRPGFPEEAAVRILPEPVESALDLGAGTGKFTTQLMMRAARVIAVEPSEQMLAVLRVRLPTVEAHIGTAERIPLADASVDAVTAAQAFHWFDREPAAAEIRRVLRPGGVLGLAWNRADPRCAWDRACSRVAHPAVGESDDDATTDAAAENLPGFLLETHTIIPWSERITRADYLARWQTVSSFLVAEPVVQARMRADIERILDDDPDTAGRSEYELPQLTEVFVYRGREDLSVAVSPRRGTSGP